MDAYQRRRGVDFSHNQRNGGFQAALRPTRRLPFKAHDAEMSPAGREVGFRDLAEVVSAAHALIITWRWGLFPNTRVEQAFRPAFIVPLNSGR